ncbi:MAG: RICIN domain-containing protein [Microthrixaceae bacterium]
MNGGTPTTYCYDHADRLTATSEAATVESNTADGTLAYDQHGNTSVLGWQAMTYDIADRHLSTTAAELNNAASAVQVRTNNNRCLDVEGPSSADGAILQQWGCNSPAVAEQTWSLVAADGQWFNLVSQLAGKCMAPQGGGTADGTKFTQGACDQSAAAQQFRLAKSGSSWQLISRPTGKCVDVPSNVSSDGTDMQLLTCSSGAANSKLFTLTTTSGPATTPTTVRADGRVHRARCWQDQRATPSTGQLEMRRRPRPVLGRRHRDPAVELQHPSGVTAVDRHRRRRRLEPGEGQVPQRQQVPPSTNRPHRGPIDVRHRRSEPALDVHRGRRRVETHHIAQREMPQLVTQRRRRHRSHHGRLRRHTCRSRALELDQPDQRIRRRSRRRSPRPPNRHVRERREQGESSNARSTAPPRPATRSAAAATRRRSC